MNKIKIPFDTRKALGWYVYALRDPKTKEVFYIGKGKGDRIIQHVSEAGKNQKSEKAKLKRIRDIESRGLQVDHLFIRTAVKTEKEAFAIEQAVIDAFMANRLAKGAAPLTNLVAGHEHTTLGLASLDTVLARHASPVTPQINRAVLVLKVNEKWEPDMNSEDILKIARGVWGVREEVRQRAEIAVVISFGIVRGVYEINRSAWKSTVNTKGKTLWIFNGKTTTDKTLRSLVGTDMGKQVRVQASFQNFLDGFKPKK